MRNYALLKDGVCVAAGEVSALPDRPDVIEQVDGVPGVGDRLVGGEWVPAVPVAAEPEARLSRLGFYERFTQAEMEAVFSAAKSNVSIEVFIEKVKAASQVDLTDPRTVAGVKALETGGLIGVGRADEILSTAGGAGGTGDASA